LFLQGALPTNKYAEYLANCEGKSASKECLDSLIYINTLLDGLNTYNIDGYCWPARNEFKS